VVSILDRFLEHARIFYFGNGGHPELYLSSADWMGRNLDKRLEILFPVTSPKLKTRLTRMLELYFEDSAQSYQLMPDGTYKAKEAAGRPVRAQQVLYENAVSAAKTDRQGKGRFQPVKHPDKK
jgi:polyphosphate kinase